MKVTGGRCAALLAWLAFVLCVSEANFLSKERASQVLIRRRRANALFEETKKGNLERECIEELCNKEEAREIFENDPETDYFYPKYLVCLGNFRASSFSASRQSTNAYPDMRSCVNAIPDQCNPLPCHENGYMSCRDGQATFTCLCKSGWQGERCEFDINECKDPSNINGGCSQNCENTPGSYHCSCKSGFMMLPNKKDCKDVDECSLMPSICGSAVCKNIPGDFECECPEGYEYNLISKSCEDIDECSENICNQLCINYPGNYSCYCDGKKGFKLAQDQKSCEDIPVCLPLNLEKNFELLYLAEQFVGVVLYLRFRLPEMTSFSAEFDLRTYDSQGVLLYAESLDQSGWLLLALRDGKIEIQFKNEETTKITTGGKVISDGLWHMISVEELEDSISVKIANEAVMNINKPGSLFKPTNGFLETKVYFAGFPRKVENALIKPINPRLDGCIRGWNLMNQGASGVKEIIQEKQKKHCLITVEKGSFYPGSGAAQFNINYNNVSKAESWQINGTLNIRPSTGTGVLFSLVSGKTVPFALALVDSISGKFQDIIVSVENTVISRIEAVNLCSNQQSHLEFRVNKHNMELSNPFGKSTIYSEDFQSQLAILDRAMKGTVVTYLGGIPDVPFSATPVNAFYNGCMDVSINGVELDLDEATSKQNDIRAHSCPSVFEYTVSDFLRTNSS
ncbi:PREDICTED: vitamin K-dependent protein S [Elephantulus edwardii]|uniref:vitamin K-dependent protein S n=1 Tax=Elephantulus edwardii TaxID=28737 RepID=UPI0003F0C8BF|nr:PREDICTED: vitamin K-dependent protein S [Elephantulus edwardii]